MPIYEYQCESCGHDMEALQKMSDPVLTECPECGKPSLKKLISAAGFRLKGSGWYETDFKNSGKKAETPEKKKDTQDANAKSTAPPCGKGACPACTD